MLLANERYWAGAGKTMCPILVVCYTNHALDQFLEGIHSFCRSEIVRVGGQSKNPVLEPFLLKNIKEKNRREKKRSIFVHHGERDILDQMYRNKDLIENASKKIKETSTKTAPILAEGFVEIVIKLAHYEAIIRRVSYRNKQKALEIWLGVTNDDAEKEFDAMDRLSPRQKLYRIWKDLILNHIEPLAVEEAKAMRDIFKLSLSTRAQLYAAWVAKAREHFEMMLENITTDKAKIEKQLYQLNTNIMELKDFHFHFRDNSKNSLANFIK